MNENYHPQAITMRIILTLALLTRIWVGSAQVYFNEQIDWEHFFEYLSAVAVINSTGDIFVTGGAGDLNSTEDLTVMASLTTDGTVLWKKKILPMPGLYGETYHLATLPNSNGILLGNYEKSLGGGNYDKQIFLTKINLVNGDTIWTKEFGQNNQTEQGWTIKPTKKGGVLISGTAFFVNSMGSTNMLFMKTDSLGNLIFRKEYNTGLEGSHYALSFAPTPDGGYLLYGYRGYFGYYLGGILETPMLDMVIVKTDSSGNQEWIKTKAPWEWKQTLFYGLDLQALPNGEFLISGLKSYRIGLPGLTTSGKYFFGRIDTLGEFVDSVTLPNMYYFFRVNRLKPTSDGNFWAIGAEKDSQNLLQTGLIMKISPNLEVLWKREYRVSPPTSTMHEMFYEGVEMPDKGFVLCGTAYGPATDESHQNGWVIRVDSMGCLEAGCHLQSEVPTLPEQDVGIELWPNPTEGPARLSLKRDDSVLLGVSVLDVQGRVVSDIQYLRGAGWHACTFDLSAEPPGVYVVQIRTSEGWAVRKLVKQ